MARVLDMFDVWRSWSVRRRLAVAGGAAVAVAGLAVAVYLITKRPGDVSNPNAAFDKQKPAIKTVDWPLYGHDLERTRYLPSKDLNPPFRSSLWSFQAGKLLEFQPIVVKDRIYFIDKDGTFYALSTDKGKVQWKRKTGSLNASAPAYANGRLFAVNLEPHQAFALRPNEHGSEVLWRHPLPGRSESSPLVHNGRVILGCESGDIFALDAKTGKTRWTVSTAGPVKGGLAYHDGTVFAGNYAGEIYAIDASSGQVKWTAHTQGGGLLRGGGVYSTPAVAWGRVYLGSLDGRIYSYLEKTGELAWSHSTGAEVYPSPAVADTPHSPPTVYAGSQDKHFYALDARTGELRWEHPLDGIVLGSSSVVGETVYVSMIGPNVGTVGYHVKNGKKVFENDQGEYNPVISDGEKIYLTGASTIRAFKPAPSHRRGGKAGAGKNRGGKQG
jgi:outer membrane protein assembly factor BamB